MDQLSFSSARICFLHSLGNDCFNSSLLLKSGSFRHLSTSPVAKNRRTTKRRGERCRPSELLQATPETLECNLAVAPLSVSVPLSVEIPLSTLHSKATDFI